MTTPPSYTIRTIEDFALVPEDRLDDCLRDFAAALHIYRHIRAAVIATAEAQGHRVPADAVRFPEFVWVDDGERISRVGFGVADSEGPKG